jgi:DNA-directed RNA polymerase specialized sigma24 family protein
MAIKSNEPREDEIPGSAPIRSTLHDRIEAFAMLDALGDATLAQRVVRLSVIGFPPAEIATMLQTTTATVYQYVYEAKKRSTSKKPKAKMGARTEA